MPFAARLPSAPLWRRLAAFGIDALAMIVATIILAGFIVIVIAVTGKSEFLADWAAKILPWLVWWGYYGRGQWRRGGTLGEKAMRIAVVSCHGGRLGLGKVALRALLALLLFWTLPVAFFSATRQTPYDRLSGVRTVLRQRS